MEQKIHIALIFAGKYTDRLQGTHRDCVKIP